MKRLKSKISTILAVTTLMLGVLPGAGFSTVQAAVAAPQITGLHDVYHSPGSTPALLTPDIQMTNGGTYSDGSIKYAITNSKTTESLSLITQSQPDTANGAVSVVDAKIYLGNGSTAKQIGSVNSTLDGQQGRALQIDYSTPLVNGDFSQSTSGGTTPGWTLNENTVTLGTYATKTQGNPVAVTGSGPYTVTGSAYNAAFGANQPYSFTTDFNYNPSSSGGKPGWATEGIARPLKSSDPFTFTASITTDKKLKLYFKGTITGTTGATPYGTIFGPEAISAPFQASAGDALAFDWQAFKESGGDDYEVYGFLVNTATQQHTEILYGRGQNQTGKTTTGTIPADGTYQFRFVAGSYDNTGALGVGASLYIDNVRVLSSLVTDAVVQSVARLVTYSNTVSLGADSERTVTVSAVNTAGETTTGTVKVHGEEKLALLNVAVTEKTPDQAKLTFNLPVGDGSKLNLVGLTVGGQQVAEVISVVGEVVNVRLTAPISSEAFTVSYADTAPSNVEFATNPNNKLAPISNMAGEYVVTPLQLVKVATDPANPNQLKLKFNKPIASSGLDLTGLTVGGKPVKVVAVVGDEVIVALDEPYKVGDPLAYNASAPSRIADAAHANNTLGNISAGAVPVIDGTVGALSLADKNGPIALSPAFDGAVNSGYAGVVPNEVDSISLSAAALHPGDTTIKVSLNGQEVSSLDDLPLVEGPNTVVVSVFDKDNPSAPLKTYTMVIYRSTDKLVSLVPSTSVLSPVFDPAVVEYRSTVPYTTKDINLTPTALDPKAKIEISIGGGAFKTVDNATASELQALAVGENTIVVRVTSQLEATPKEYKLIVTRLRENITYYSSGGGGSSGPASNTQTITVDVVIGGDKLADITKVDIERTKHADGKLTDQVTFTAEKAKEAAEKAKAKGEHIARIVIPDAQDEVSEIRVDVPKEALALLLQNNIDLEIQTVNGTIQIPRSSLEGLTEDFYFRLVPIKDANERKAVEERARIEQVVRNIAGNNQIDVVARPMTIETNITSRSVTLTLPLRDVVLPLDPQERQNFLDELGIFIEHTDGEKVVVSGKVVTQANGELGLRFSVNKFSTFTILHIAGLKADGQHKHYINGYEDSTFKPNQGTTRAEIATMLVNLGAAGTGTVEGSGLPDVANSHWAAQAIGLAKNAGLLSGYENGQFRPEAKITRAEIAVIVFKYLGLTEAAKSNSFSDVSADHWANGIIAAVQAKGILSGYPDGTFQPGRELTRAEAVTLLNRLFHRGPLTGVSVPSWSDAAREHWAFEDIQEASKDHSFKKLEQGGEIRVED
jgi:hypothetical protein